MNGAATGIAILAVLVAAVAVVYLVARDRSRARQPGVPDATTDEVVSGLMTELRKWHAESAYWKAAAERLQREIDQR